MSFEELHPALDLLSEIVYKMRIDFSKPMVVDVAALTFRTSISAPIDHLVSKTKISLQEHDLDGTLDDLPSIIMNIISPILTLLDSVGLNDPSKLSDDVLLTEAQKAIVSRLEEAVSLAIREVLESLSVVPTENDKTTDAAFRSTLDLLPPIPANLFSPIACLLDSFGFSGKLPLTAEEDTIIRKLQAAISDAIKQLDAPSLKPHPRVKWEIGSSPRPGLSRQTRVQKRRFDSASGFKGTSNKIYDHPLPVGHHGDRLRPYSMRVDSAADLERVSEIKDDFELDEFDDFGDYVRQRFGRISPVLDLGESPDEYSEHAQDLARL